MSRDSQLGLVLGFVAGWTVLWAQGWALYWGLALLGPLSSTELTERPGDVSGRGALRLVLANLLACIVVGIVVLGLSLPARSFVDSWRVFRSNWGLAFMVALVLQTIRSRRRAK